MTSSVVAHSTISDAARCGAGLAQQIITALDGRPPDVLIVFASARYDYSVLLRAIAEGCRPEVMVGCSSAGEFITHSYNEGAVSVLAMRSDTMLFHATIGRNLRADRAGAARQIAAGFRGRHAREFPFRTALVLTDALAGHAEDLIEQLTALTAGSYQLFGGGAGDDARFARTHVFIGTDAVPDAAVALEILSTKPVGIGIRHSWEPGSPPMRVTAAHGLRLVSVNDAPAVEMFEAHAAATGQRFDRRNPMPFFLHNVVGMPEPAGYRLRVPLGVHDDGSIPCAAEIPAGCLVHLMTPKGGSAADATRRAIEQLRGHEPGAALFFDCVATRLRMGRGFDLELDRLRSTLGPVAYAGCNTYGQIVRGEGQFNGFHNCAAVVAVLPK